MEIGLQALRLYITGQSFRGGVANSPGNGSNDGWAASSLSGTLTSNNYKPDRAGYNNPTLSPITTASHHNHDGDDYHITPNSSSAAASNNTLLRPDPFFFSNFSRQLDDLSSSLTSRDPGKFSAKTGHHYFSTLFSKRVINASEDEGDHWSVDASIPMIVSVRRVLLSGLDLGDGNNNNTESTTAFLSVEDAGNFTHYHNNDTSMLLPLDYRNWWALIGIVFILAGLLGNVLVCCAVITDRRLQTPTNYFLLSLAIADLLVSVLVMPLGMSVEIMSYWPFNFPTCVLYSFSDIFCCTASIMHMCMISIDRYMGISRPLTHRTRSVRFDIGMKILGVWLVSFAVSCPVIFVSVFHDRATVLSPLDHQCNLSNKLIMIIGSLLAFFIPQLVMGIMMTKTLLLLRKQAKWSAGKRGTTYQAPRIVCKRPSTPATDALLADGKQANSKSRSNSQGNNNTTTTKKSNGVAHNSAQPDIASNSDSPEDDPCSSNSPARTPNARNAGRIVAAMNLLNRKNKQKKARQIDSEKKATTVLGLVFGVFCLCWTPFFIMNVIYALCEDGCNIPPVAFTFFLWLGWVSSTVNPMIYTVVNPNFRQAFFRLLSLGSLGKQCRGAVRVSVQNFRGVRPDDNPKTPNVIVVRRASKHPAAAGGLTNDRAAAWSPNFLIALKLNNETPV
ncbi:D(2) dopamine receptor A [Hypsibius exemplaris]|uniref:D(2) dopamine receptor A n=1 Tax=Hypsibius exemplaris TaxID=2072580 RepID=A0A1W0WTH0_HYPEX|nr:D(2) dopamine receptor A [Hypsibius exemplaris]